MVDFERMIEKGPLASEPAVFRLKGYVYAGEAGVPFDVLVEAQCEAQARAIVAARYSKEIAVSESQVSFDEAAKPGGVEL